MEGLAQRAAEGLQAAFGEVGIAVQVVVAGSIFRLYFLEQPPRNFRQAAQDDAQMHRWLFFALLNKGLYTRNGRQRIAGDRDPPHRRAGAGGARGGTSTLTSRMTA